METNAELTEIYAVSDTFVSGLGEVEDIGGGCLRFIFFSRHTHEGREELQIVARIIMPVEAVPVAIRMAARKAHICVCQSNRAGTH